MIAKVIDEEREAHDVVWWKEYRDCFTGTNGYVYRLMAFVKLSYEPNRLTLP
jgi:hypothetical protein